MAYELYTASGSQIRSKMVKMIVRHYNGAEKEKLLEEFKKLTEGLQLHFPLLFLKIPLDLHLRHEQSAGKQEG